MVKSELFLPNYDFTPGELMYDQSEDCKISEMCVECCVAQLKRSKYGQDLAKNPPRFSNFHWEDLVEFCKYMGPDVDPVMHGAHQAEVVAIPMVQHQNSESSLGKFYPFNKEEGKLLVLANVFHDAHESIVGDIPAPLKTKEGMQMELELNLKVVAEILGIAEDDPWMLKYRSVVGDFEQWSPLGRAFAVGEQIGYFLTGLRAWGMRNHTQLDAETREKCLIMGKEVCLTAAEKIVPYCTELAFAGFVLDSNAKAIEQMYRTED